MNQLLAPAVFVSSVLFASFVDAKNVVVVIPLFDSPRKTEIAFPRISTQCQSNEYVFLEGLDSELMLEDPNFYLDDSESANPRIIAAINSPELPGTTSRISIFVSGIDDHLDAEIRVRDISGQKSLSTDLNDCTSATNSTPFGSSQIQSDSQSIISNTGKTWSITSNSTVKDGVITLGPTLFRLAQ